MSVPTASNMHLSVNFGEPVFNSSPIYTVSLRGYVDCGSYVSFKGEDDEICYGRLISTSRQTGISTNKQEAIINEYLELHQLCETTGAIQQPINNPYICVKELVQTTKVTSLPSTSVTGIIFI